MATTTGAPRPIVFRSPMPVATFKSSSNSRSIVSPAYADKEGGVFANIKQMIKMRRGGVHMQEASSLEKFDGKKPSWTNNHDGHREMMRTMSELKEGGGGIRTTVKAGWNRRAIASVAKAFGGARKMKPRSSQTPALPPRPLGKFAETEYDSASTMGNLSPSQFQTTMAGIASFDFDSDASDSEGELDFEAESNVLVSAEAQQEVDSANEEEQEEQEQGASDSNAEYSSEYESDFSEIEQESDSGSGDNEEEEENDEDTDSEYYEPEIDVVDDNELEVDRESYFVGHDAKGSVMFTKADGSKTSVPIALLPTIPSMRSETESYASEQEEQQDQQQDDFESDLEQGGYHSEGEYGGVMDSVNYTASHTSNVSSPSFRSEIPLSVSEQQKQEQEQQKHEHEQEQQQEDFESELEQGGYHSEGEYGGVMDSVNYTASHASNVSSPSFRSDFPLSVSDMPSPPSFAQYEASMIDGDDDDNWQDARAPRVRSSIMPPPSTTKSGLHHAYTQESDLPFGMPFGFRASSPHTPQHLVDGMSASPPRSDVVSNGMESDGYDVYRGGMSVREPAAADGEESEEYYDDVPQFDDDVDDQQQEEEEEVAPLTGAAGMFAQINAMRAPSVQLSKPKSGRAGMFDQINAMRVPSVVPVAQPPAAAPQTQAPQESSTPPVSTNGQDYAKYYTMLKIGLPEGAVAQAMARDGVDESGFDFNFTG